MTSVSRGTWALLACLILGTFCLFQLQLHYQSPYPPITTSLSTSKTDLNDVGGVVLGFRRLAADVAWVQTLQYYGTPENGQSESEFENGLGKYPDFLTYCQHAVRIDPYFTYVYYYGAGVLGWNLNRVSEAEDLLKQGIIANPTEWRLHQYLAALAYQKSHNTAELLRFLESIVQDPQCPLMMKALLANVYKKQRLFDKALATWEIIYQSGDPSYMHRAIEQVQEIQRLRKAHS